MDERRLTPAQWSEVFGLEQIPMTREEYLAGLQARSLGVLIEILHAVKHTEGMQSSYDDFLARYAQVIGVPFIPSEEVQTALREHRLALYEAAQEQMKLAFEQRNGTPAIASPIGE
jgi:hypothetical protein